MVNQKPYFFQNKNHYSQKRAQQQTVMESGTDFLVVFFGIGFRNQGRDGRRESNSQRHSNENKTIAQGNGSQFGGTQISHHKIINDSN